MDMVRSGFAWLLDGLEYGYSIQGCSSRTPGVNTGQRAGRSGESEPGNTPEQSRDGKNAKYEDERGQASEVKK
jgi:hypothetical protein